MGIRESIVLDVYSKIRWLGSDCKQRCQFDVKIRLSWFRKESVERQNSLCSTVFVESNVMPENRVFQQKLFWVRSTWERSILQFWCSRYIPRFLLLHEELQRVYCCMWNDNDGVTMHDDGRLRNVIAIFLKIHHYAMYCFIRSIRITPRSMQQ